MTVTFSEAVVVTGGPQLAIEVGTRQRAALYESGTGTTALVFVYEVGEGDEDSDGGQYRGKLLYAGRGDDPERGPATMPNWLMTGWQPMHATRWTESGQSWPQPAGQWSTERC